MTRYILHGGANSIKSADNDRFFAKFSDHQKPLVNIILCYWARKKAEWQKLYDRDKPKIMKQAKGKTVQVDMVTAAADFDSKIGNADTLYFAGGDINLLKNEINKIHNFKKKITGKLVIGSSAGAYLIGKYSINSFDREGTPVNKGFGLLPLSVLAHYDIEGNKKRKVQALQQVAPTLPIITLHEGQSVEFILNN